jgi:predicted acylesterase/phospholipase RssA
MPYTFRLGITLAGAVSAGCYTAGAMDYLLECLEAWEEAKRHGHPHMARSHVPKTQVRLDVVGGSSAGGMTAMLLALAYLHPRYRRQSHTACSPHADAKTRKASSLFHKTWVRFETTNAALDLPARLFDLSDRGPTGARLPSAINGSFLDDLAQSLFERPEDGAIEDMVNTLPPYISQDLEVLLTHTLLEGIPLTVDFEAQTAHAARKDGAAAPRPKTRGPHHTSYEHHLQSHFRLNKGRRPDTEAFLWLNPLDARSAERMHDAALATGAFPIGLPPRSLRLPWTYIKAAIHRNIYRNYGRSAPIRDLDMPFSRASEEVLLTVDGGAINNEPFQEVIDVLRAREAPSPSSIASDAGSAMDEDREDAAPDYGIMLIDPFPDHAPREADGDEANEEAPMRLSAIAARMVRVLWNSAKTKRREMLRDDQGPILRGQVWPVKYRDPKRPAPGGSSPAHALEKLPYPMASGSLEAFGGLFSEAFREHDYQLGRANMRNFIGHWFRLPYEASERHPMHQEWSQEALECFGFTDAQDGKRYVPIIPDFSVLTARGSKDYRFNDYGSPPAHQLPVAVLKDLRKPMYARVKALIKDELQERSRPASKRVRSDTDRGSQKRDTVRAFYDSVYANRGAVDAMLGSLGAWVGRQAFRLAPRVLSNNLSSALMKRIIKDLAERELLDQRRMAPFQASPHPMPPAPPRDSGQDQDARHS